MSAKITQNMSLHSDPSKRLFFGAGELCVLYPAMSDTYNSINKLITSMLDMRVEVQVSDPWEFAGSIPDEPITAIIKQVAIRVHHKLDSTLTHEEVLLNIEKPFGYKGLKYQHIIASPRHCGKGLAEFISEGKVSFNFLRIPQDVASSDDPFFSGVKWRGGPEAFTGSLQLQ